MSPMQQAATAPMAAPSQLRLILPCQDWLASLPLTAHQWGSGSLWTHQTLAALFGQCCDTTGDSTQHLTFKSVFGYIFQAKTWTLVFMLLLETAVAMCCSLAVPSCTTVVWQHGDGLGSPGPTKSWSHVGSLGLPSCRFHADFSSKPIKKILPLFTLTSANHTLI